MLLATWSVKKTRMQKCEAETCGFRDINKHEVSLTVRVLVDDVIVSEDQGICDEFFDQLKQRFLAKDIGKLNMYTDCAFERDCNNEFLEMNQTAFA